MTLTCHYSQSRVFVCVHTCRPRRACAGEASPANRSSPSRRSPPTGWRQSVSVWRRFPLWRWFQRSRSKTLAGGGKKNKKNDKDRREMIKRRIQIERVHGRSGCQATQKFMIKVSGVGCPPLTNLSCRSPSGAPRCRTHLKIFWPGLHFFLSWPCSASLLLSQLYLFLVSQVGFTQQGSVGVALKIRNLRFRVRLEIPEGGGQIQLNRDYVELSRLYFYICRWVLWCCWWGSCWWWLLLPQLEKCFCKDSKHNIKQAGLKIMSKRKNLEVTTFWGIKSIKKTQWSCKETLKLK